jgi:hypothetical protein
MSYVTMNRLPSYTQDIFRFINGQPVRVPTIDNIGINRFASIGRSDDMIGCNSNNVPSHHDPRLMTLDQMVEYQRHPTPVGDNALRYGL